MNTYELDTLTLNYIRRPIDDDARTELSEFFTVAYNEIYRRIMGDPYKLTETEAVMLKNRCFSINELAKSFIGVKVIKSRDGVKYVWEKGDGNNINVHTNDKTVNVTYYFMPATLKNITPTSPPDEENGENTPVIPTEYHNIFSLWAAYRYLHSRRQFEDAGYYYEMAMELFYQLRDKFSERTKIKVNYF